MRGRMTKQLRIVVESGTGRRHDTHSSAHTIDGQPKGTWTILYRLRRNLLRDSICLNREKTGRRYTHRQQQ